MKRIFVIISFLFATSAFSYVPYYFNYTTILGFNGAWGYVPWVYAPNGYWYYPNYSGYSFYSNYGYEPRYSTYGAISYSHSTGNMGYSWGQSYFRAAVNVANNNCRAVDCEPVVWVQGGCAVVTASDSAQHITWGVGTNRREAFHASLRACVGADGRRAPDCTQRAWICTD